MATVTVDQNTSHQTIYGWGAGQDVGTADYPVDGENWRDDLLDAAVDAGLNAVHMTLQVSEVENTTDYFQAWLDANSDYPHAARTAWIQSNGAPVNDDNDPDNYNASGFKWGRLTDTMTRVVTPLRTKLAARGESLFLSFVMGHTSLNNQFFVDDPDEYGEWVLAVWNRFYSTYGFVPSALEIMGEPDHGDRLVTPAELVAMLASARTRLLAAGYAEPMLWAPGTVSGPDAEQYYLDMKTANATAAGYIDALTYHRYVDIDDSNLATLKSTASTDGKGVAMTEYDQRMTLVKVWSDLKVGHCSAVMALSFGYPSSTDTGHLFYSNLGGPYTVTPVTRTKYLKHIWYAVRNNAVRKAASISGTGSANGDPLAFRNTNGTYAVVVKCTGAVDFDIAGLPNGTYEVRRTLGDLSSAPSTEWESLSDQTVSGGNTGTISMSGAGMVTIYDQNYLASTFNVPGRRSRMMALFT